MLELNKYTYSVIIPHRDSFELLKRALASIPDRADIQIIVIDNSTYEIDFHTLDIKRMIRFELLYSDIEGGAGHARNVGLSKAIGKWLLFLDSDDFYNPGAFEQFDLFINSDFDIVYFSASSVYSDTLDKAERSIKYTKLVDEFIKGKTNAEDNLRYQYFSPCSKLIRSKLVQNHTIRFDEVPASNDLMFSIKSGHYANKIYAIDFPAYCMTVNRGSLTRTINQRNSRSRFCVAIMQYKFMTSVGRLDQRFKLMALVIQSFRFGFIEAYWYIKTSHKERVNIFIGMDRWSSVLIRYFFGDKKRDNYYTIKK